MKKKYTSLQLQIPEPCQQSWEEMIPLPGGRFCRHCEKTVVDFTRMADRDIARLYLRREGRVCGHFRQDQLNKRLPLPAPVSRWQKFRAIGALLSGLLLSGAAAAQTALQQPLIIVPSIGQKPGLQTASRLLKGIVTDEAGEPLIGAAIALAAADGPGRILAGTASLADGRFELKIPERAKQFHLTISYLGYEEQILELSPAELAGNQAIQVQLKAASYNLEEVQVIAYNSSMTSTMGLISGVAVVHEGEKEKKKELEPTTEQVEILHLFPNPFTTFVNVEFDQPQPGRLLFHLYDASGKLVFAQMGELPKGRQVIPLDFSGRHLPAGTYFLRISDSVGEIRTKPLVKVD